MSCLKIKRLNLSFAVRIFSSLLLLLIYSDNMYAQNLIANGSFEEENICTEYKQNCAPEAWICSSLKSYNYFDDGNHAYEGRHFVGVITGNKQVRSVRTFMRTRLLCGLRKGHQYMLQFYVSSRHAVFDSIGVYFAETDFLFEKRHYSQLIPVSYIRDSLNATANETMAWKKISILYTATGEEIFLTIGSFKIQEYRYYAAPEIQGNYYLHIDDVRFTPVNNHEMICNTRDSTKAAIYAENERHNVLEKRIAYYRKNVPAELKMPSTILQRIDTLIIPDILFATGSAKLYEKTYSVLDSFCQQLTSKNIDSIRVDGHTDSVGTLIFNNRLSADRAGAVSSYIIQQANVDSDKLLVRYYAYLRPVATNLTSQGRQRNRRVEIFLYTHE